MLTGKKIVIAGGSGFIGQHMAARWAGVNEVFVLTRDNKEHNNSYGKRGTRSAAIMIHWDGEHAGDWTKVLDGCDLLINMAGRSVNCRYTEANKAEIFSSRLNSTRILGEAVLKCKTPPVLWINAASATIYPHATTTARDERFTDFADDFSVQVCKAWERCFEEIRLPVTRKAILRTAITLGDGGVMVPFKRLVRLGLGGAQGSGEQMFSWIHIVDLCRIVEWVYNHPEQAGTFNAAAPGPVTNSAFMASLRKALSVRLRLPAPAWLLKLGALLIGTETELVLKSRWVLPRRLTEQGFVFMYPEIDAALKSLIDNSDRKSHPPEAAFL